MITRHPTKGVCPVYSEPRRGATLGSAPFAGHQWHRPARRRQALACANHNAIAIPQRVKGTLSDSYTRHSFTISTSARICSSTLK